MTLYKVWNGSGSLRRSVFVSDITTLIEQGCQKLNLPTSDGVKVFLKNGTEIEDNEIFTSLPAGTILYLLAQNEPHPASLNRRSQQPRGGEKTPRKIIFTSLTKDVKLHESENAWKPLCKTDGPSDVDDVEMELTKLKRNVQGVLNKLTPQKFETLMLQLKNLNIDTEDKLNIVIDLIYENAIYWPFYSVPYANLCKHLQMIKVPLVGQASGKCVNFRKLMLIKCQTEFEQDRTDEIKNQERLKAIQAAEGTKKKELQLEFDAEEKKMRYRQLGNIRFIGELFKLNMLIEPIMHECIKRLLTQADEESLECLCKLLKTIGKELDDSKTSKNRDQPTVMDSYFNEMQRYVDKRLTSSRVRFMLQDVIDLKKCYWVPRRDENNPKTIDQIHKEAEREALKLQLNLHNMNNYHKRTPADRDRRKNTGRNLGTSEDVRTSSTKSNKGSYNVVDPTKPDEVESIRLGPSGRELSSWGRIASGGTKNAAESEKNVTNNWCAASSCDRNSGQIQPSAMQKTSSISMEREKLLKTIKGFSRLSRKTESAVSSQISSQEVKKHLTSLLEKTEENEEIFDWIDANVSENTDSLFIRALVTAVHENVITGTDSRFELDQIKLKKRIPLLSHYIGKNKNSELQALYAIQALIHDLEQPRGILRNIFDILYDDDVINVETFKTWEQSEDPAEIEGKGEALHWVKSFFMWLRETEDEEPED